MCSDIYDKIIKVDGQSAVKSGVHTDGQQPSPNHIERRVLPNGNRLQGRQEDRPEISLKCAAGPVWQEATIHTSMSISNMRRRTNPPR